MATNKTVTVTVLPTLSGDTVASYNVYEGVSGTTLLGTMTVGEAAAGKVFAFTDGIVHSVKAQTVWATAGASAIKSAGVTLDLTSSFLFEDDFTGSTIDTTTKWNLANPDTNVTFTQNGDLTMASNGSSAGTVFENGLTGQSAITLSSIVAITFDITSADPSLGTWFIGVTQDTNPVTNADKFGITGRGSDSAQVIIIERDSSTSQTQDANLDLTSLKTIKIVVGATTLDFYYWNGASWTALGLQVTHAQASGGSWYPTINGSDVSAESMSVAFDNFVIADADFTTLRP